MPSDSWRSRFDTLLLHCDRILIQGSNEGYYLPRVEFEDEIEFDDFQIIKAQLELELGIAVNVLYYADYQIDREQRQIKGIYVLEPQVPTEEIPTGIWCALSTIDNLSFVDPEQKSVVKTYLTEIESGNTPKLRPPWAQPRWFAKASAWIDEQLEKLKYKRIGSIEYVRSWSISCVLKVQTTAGTIYFKTASRLPLFCDEPAVTTELANLFPRQIPTVISIDRQRHWMLLADFGESTGSDAAIEIKQAIYRSFAQIQIESIPYRDRLLTAGCLDRRLNILQSQVDPLIEDEAALAELSIAEIEQLRNLAPKLKNLCEQLADYEIPETLVHGDLHLDNVALYKNEYLFFDWTDSCIAHPFFDLYKLFFSSDRSKQLYRDCYLNQWTQYELSPYGTSTSFAWRNTWGQARKCGLGGFPHEQLSQEALCPGFERLLDAWKVAKPLCALHHAVTYQHMSHSLEPRAKQELNALPYFLRKIIECLT